MGLNESQTAIWVGVAIGVLLVVGSILLFILILTLTLELTAINLVGSAIMEQLFSPDQLLLKDLK